MYIASTVNPDQTVPEMQSDFDSWYLATSMIKVDL